MLITYSCGSMNTPNFVKKIVPSMVGTRGQLSLVWLALGDTIWGMDLRYNFVYILLTILGAIFLSGESNLQSNVSSIENVLEYR